MYNDAPGRAALTIFLSLCYQDIRLPVLDHLRSSVRRSLVVCILFCEKGSDYVGLCVKLWF